MKRHFTREGIGIAKKYLKKCSFREMQTRTTTRYYYTLIKLPSVGKEVEELEPAYIAGAGTVALENSFSFLMKLNMHLPCDPQLLLSIDPREMKTKHKFTERLAHKHSEKHYL